MGFPPVEDGWVRAVEDGPGRGFRWVFLGEVALGAVLAGCAWAVLPGLGPQLGGEPGWGDPCRGFSAGVSDSPDAVESESKTPGIRDTTVDVVDAQRWLCALPLREVEGVEGYRRQAFGAGWLDLDGDGCDTRQEILARDLDQVQHGDGDFCKVTGGEFQDPYTGQSQSFTQAPRAQVQIDHVVALSDAWDSGAWRWSARDRQRYANSPEVLLAVLGSANEDKGAANAAQWLPPNRGYRCPYAYHQVYIKYRWGLSVTAAERRALWAQLQLCH